MDIDNRLRYEWSFYIEKYHDGKNYKDWLQSVLLIISFRKSSEFWNFFNNSAPPSFLLNQPSSSSSTSVLLSYRLFKSQFSLEQYDPVNISGGRLLFQKSEDFDETWLKLILIVISNEFGDDIMPYIVGIVSKVTKINNYETKNSIKGLRYELWLRSGINQDIISNVSNILRNKLDLTVGESLTYRQHSSS
jgi:hypothetical protein